ncbi:hypothetical protein CTI12_AA007040 [Artemisia annua]|uniref:Retrotransposon gag domain-containing protein n=1 Tax=Artemisia annua TaxID=35608 RepID=A0A2U1QLN1_ARTAN|nr:hypothetical protein CTI12_AA007040 [Artemisia annua]
MEGGNILDPQNPPQPNQPPRARTLGEYSRPSHQGYRNTIELTQGANVSPLRSDTIWLVQSGCAFHGIRSITSWDDLTTRFLAQFLPLGRTTKLRNDILMFQQRQGETIYETWTRFKDLLQKVPHHGIDLWLQIQIFYDHINLSTRQTIDQVAGGRLRDRSDEESLELIEDLALYDNESWNDPRDLNKKVKAISLPSNNSSTPNCRIMELKDQVKFLMKSYEAPKPSSQVNKITSSCEYCSGPHDTHNCMELPEQAFADYASSRTDGAGDKWYTFKPEPNPYGDSYNLSWRNHPNLSSCPQCYLVNAMSTCFKQTQVPQRDHESKISNSKLVNNIVETPPTQNLDEEFKELHLERPVIDVLTRAPYYNALLEKYEERLQLGKSGTTFVQNKLPKKLDDPDIFVLPCKIGNSEALDTLADLGSSLNLIPLPLYTTLKLGKLEETEVIIGLADGSVAHPLGMIKDMVDHVGRLTILADFHVLDMVSDTTCPLLVGRGFLAISSAMIDCKDTELDPFEDPLVFRKMIDFLGVLPINLGMNRWKCEDNDHNWNWDKPPKYGDGLMRGFVTLQQVLPLKGSQEAYNPTRQCT